MRDPEIGVPSNIDGNSKENKSEGIAMHAVITVLCTLIGVGGGFFLGQHFNKEYSQLNDSKLRNHYAKECYESMDTNLDKIRQLVLSRATASDSKSAVDVTSIVSSLNTASQKNSEKIEASLVQLKTFMSNDQKTLEEALTKIQEKIKKIPENNPSENRLLTLLNDLEDNKVKLVECPK